MAARSIRFIGYIVFGACVLVGAAASCQTTSGGNEIPDAAGGGGATPTGPGSGGSTGCTDASSCGTTTTCRVFTCDDGECSEALTDANTSCEDGRGCDADNPCVCDGEGSCVLATCMDGLLNGTESDLDCGGECPGCENGEDCGANTDCEDGYCDVNVCAACTVTSQCDDDKYCLISEGAGGAGTGGTGGV